MNAPAIEVSDLRKRRLEAHQYETRSTIGVNTDVVILRFKRKELCAGEFERQQPIERWVLGSRTLRGAYPTTCGEV